MMDVIRITPMNAETHAANLPPTILVTNGFYPLRDDAGDMPTR